MVENLDLDPPAQRRRNNAAHVERAMLSFLNMIDVLDSSISTPYLEVNTIEESDGLIIEARVLFNFPNL